MRWPNIDIDLGVSSGAVTQAIEAGEIVAELRSIPTCDDDGQAGGRRHRINGRADPGEARRRGDLRTDPRGPSQADPGSDPGGPRFRARALRAVRNSVREAVRSRAACCGSLAYRLPAKPRLSAPVLPTRRTWLVSRIRGPHHWLNPTAVSPATWVTLGPAQYLGEGLLRP